MLGYGAQGRAEAENLRRSGVHFRIGLRESGPSARLAKQDGFEVSSIESTVNESEVLLMNLPDEAQASVYEKSIRNSSVRYLIFAHGFNTHFQLIPSQEDGPIHVLIAPKGAASGLQQYYGKPEALPAILALQQGSRLSPTNEEKVWIEDLAQALGAHPQGLTWASFKDECVCDLFSEQVLLCGGVSQLLKTSYEVLVESGYNPETAYFETLYELKLIVDLIWKQGITGMRAKISPTARYGDITRGHRVIDEHVKTKMKEVLKEIESGEFAKEFLKQANSDRYLQEQSNQSQHPIEQIGRDLRKKFEA